MIHNLRNKYYGCPTALLIYKIGITFRAILQRSSEESRAFIFVSIYLYIVLLLL